MSLYRIDGWDYYPGGTTPNISVNTTADGWYQGAGNLTTFPGRFGKGLSLGFAGSVFNMTSYEAIGKRWTTETTVIGQAFYYPTGTGSGFSFGINDGQGGQGPQFNLEFDTLGIIRLYRFTSAGGASQVLIATTAAKVWHNDEWNYLEVKFKVHATAGLVEVRINTVTVLSFAGNTGCSTAPVLSLPYGWDSIYWSGSLSFNDDTNQLRWDDRYILDNVGTNNIDYLGNVRVNCQLPTAAGAVTQMSVFGAAANWDAVNDSALTETEYVYDSVMTDRDLYTLDPNVTAQNVLGVQITGAHRQDDSTQLKSNLILKTHAVEYAGSDHFLAQTYHYYRDIWDLNPNTGVGWTTAELNALQAGQKVLLG